MSDSMEVDAPEGSKALPRNTACHQCRKRKLKCNGARPHCSNCSKPRVRDMKMIDGKSVFQPNCTWDETRQIPKDQFANPAIYSSPSMNTERFASTSRNPPAEILGRPALDSIDQSASGSAQPFGDITDWLSSAPHSTSLGVEDGQALWASANFATSSASSSSSGAMVLPDWPRELPPLETVDHIIDIFFQKVPTFPKMLRRAALSEDIRLPPRHPRFPPRPLLHAILGITAAYLPSIMLAHRDYWPVCTPGSAIRHPENEYDLYLQRKQADSSNSPNAHGDSGSRKSALDRFQRWHRRHALEGMRYYVERGQAYLQLIQAYVLVAAIDQFNADYVSLWESAATCMRHSVPLRLCDSRTIPSTNIIAFGTNPCPVADSALEQAEKDRTWWMVYLMERTASMWTGWPLTLADDEITCELPVLQQTFDAGYGELLGTQSIHDLDIYVNHPPIHLDSFTLFIKAVKLFADAQKFFRFYQRGTHSMDQYVNEPGLRALLSHINSFRLSIPSDMRRPMQAAARGQVVDRDLLTAILLSHGTAVILGEPLITRTTWEHEIAKMSLGAIRSILSLLYDISATSYDVTLLPPTVSYIFSLAAKGLLRFVDAANHSGDTISAGVFLSEVQVFQMTLKQYGERFPIGHQHTQLLDALLAEQRQMGTVSVDIHRYASRGPTRPHHMDGAVGFSGGSITAAPSPYVQTPSSTDSAYPPSHHQATPGVPQVPQGGYNADQAQMDHPDQSTAFSFTTPNFELPPELDPKQPISTAALASLFAPEATQVNFDDWFKTDPNDGQDTLVGVDHSDITNMSYDPQELSKQFRYAGWVL